jgi:hypothetical protein
MAEYGARKGSVVAYARVAGSATKPYYMKDEEFDADLIDFTVTSVLLKVGIVEQDVTLGYKVAQDIKSDFVDVIDEAVKAHMEYLFSNETNERPEADHTDTAQELPYEVVATARHDEGVTIVEPIAA